MPKTKQQPNKLLRISIILSALTLVLVVVCAVLAIALHTANSKISSDRPARSISLGIMQYRFADNKAIKRNDASVNMLQTFLEAKASHERCSVQRPAYEHVTAYNKEETQVLLSFGCGAADGTMYIVKADGAWKPLSPTNHFDHLGIPECDYLTENDISAEIAPVCANGLVNALASSDPAYIVR